MNSFGKKLIDRFVKQGVSPHKLAWSSALGVYLAFSPFLGIQTILMFILAFLLRAKTAVVFTVLYAINNPWTMLPILLMDYFFGMWIFRIFSIDMSAYEPAWMDWFNHKLTSYLTPYLGIEQINLWPYLIGGNIIALVAGSITYPIIKKIYLKGLSSAPQSVAAQQEEKVVSGTSD